jgi:hypothetical protein
MMASKFSRLAADAEWTDQSLLRAFYNALNEDVKDILTGYDRPEKLSEFIQLAIRVDNRLFERRQEKRGGFHSKPHRFEKRNPVGRDSFRKPVMMDIDQIERHGPISNAEKRESTKERIMLILWKRRTCCKNL